QSGALVIDGGTGTEIQARGVRMDDAAWCAIATLEHPDVVRSVHEDYTRAGARVVIANTFSGGRAPLEDAGFGDRIEEVNRRAVELAREARERAGQPDVRVAGSLSRETAFHLDDASRGLRRAELADAFSEQARYLADAGADLITLEMISDAEHGEPAVEAA